MAVVLIYSQYAGLRYHLKVPESAVLLNQERLSDLVGPYLPGLPGRKPIGSSTSIGHVPMFFKFVDPPIR